ncbi:MAG: AAA family ATPase [Bacteroides sp.]|nr:AAA family ATPase [Bacteroides sp.]
MLLSIDNFKSIERVADIDISSLTVLAGINSSGKSSLIQALLLLKQTLTSSSNDILSLNGPYVYANSLMDLMHNKKSGFMKFGVKIIKEELPNDSITLSKFKSQPISLEISVIFRVRTDSVVISEFKMTMEYEDGNAFRLRLSHRPRKDVYDLHSTNRNLTDLVLDGYSFANFFPIYVNKDGTTYDLWEVKLIREVFIEYLDKIVYIAPLRVAPVLSRTYQTDVETRYVLPDGENTRFIIDKVSDDEHTLNLIKEWICNRFHLAKDLSVIKESGKRYRVVVTTNENVKVDLMHMGFGLSQILPIITQGCISQPNSLLIIEDPDVHMHPSIQASMADFFIFLCEKRKVAVLIETHSDHFITRLRRRIAEKNITPNIIHLIFVANDYGESVYQTIPLSENGKMEGSMPSGFMDSLDNDFRAILETNRR